MTQQPALQVEQPGCIAGAFIRRDATPHDLAALAARLDHMLEVDVGELRPDRKWRVIEAFHFEEEE